MVVLTGVGLNFPCTRAVSIYKRSAIVSFCASAFWLVNIRLAAISAAVYTLDLSGVSFNDLLTTELTYSDLNFWSDCFGFAPALCSYSLSLSLTVSSVLALLVVKLSLLFWTGRRGLDSEFVTLFIENYFARSLISSTCTSSTSSSISIVSTLSRDMSSSCSIFMSCMFFADWA